MSKEVEIVTPEEAQAILNLLDRTPTTGHQERNTMNVLCNKLFKIANPDQKIADPPAEIPGKDNKKKDNGKKKPTNRSGKRPIKKRKKS